MIQMLEESGFEKIDDYDKEHNSESIFNKQQLVKVILTMLSITLFLVIYIVTKID